MRRPRVGVSLRPAALLAALLVAAAACVGLMGASVAAVGSTTSRHHHHACSPAPQQPVTEAVHTAAAIFAGKVTAVRRRVATVSVGTKVKGSPAGTEKIRFAKGWHCGDMPTVKDTYVFFVTGATRSYVVPSDLPTSSRGVDKTIAEAKQLLAPPPPSVTLSKPLAGQPRPFLHVAAPGIAAIIVALIGLLFVRFRRA